MKSFLFSTFFVATGSLVSAVCPTGQVRVTLLGGVSNEEFCQVSGSCGMCGLLKSPGEMLMQLCCSDDDREVDEPNGVV